MMTGSYGGTMSSIIVAGNHENSQCYYMRSLDGLHWVIESKLDYSQVMKMGADSLGLEKLYTAVPVSCRMKKEKRFN